MIFSKKFVNDYVSIEDKDIMSIANDMTNVGNEYDDAGDLIRANKLVIGKVIKCENHPDSDHLHVLSVDIGSEVLQIVCGAPNAREGIKVIVALDGAVLPDGVIKKSVIRGVESNGMCCSIKELGLDKKFLSEEDINGIHELPNDATTGEDALKYMELDDQIINFELTSNRADLLSMIGLAYEVGAIYNRKVNIHKPNYNTVKDNFKEEVKLEVNTENSKAFLLGRVKNVTIKESPLFIKNRLIASGIRPINNVVDISNYVMLETGQPLHFYDADEVGDYLGVRMAYEGEEFTTLDGVKRKLSSKDIVICNKKEATCLAGVMGGLNTEITDKTKNILIESAHFNGASIRRTSKKILRSEASNRFEKGIDINMTYYAMERSKELLEKYANAEVSEYTHEYLKLDRSDTQIEITVDKINQVLGMNISEEDICDVFNRLGFSVSKNNQILTVTVPTRRRDISIKEDLIEEVGRIYGVDKLEAKLPIAPTKPGHVNKYKREIKHRLASLGLNEVISYSLINEEDADRFLDREVNHITVLEPMIEKVNTLRSSIIPSLIKIYEYNRARNNKDVSIFEIGESFYKEGNEYIEENKLSILMSGELISGINTKINVDFYYIKGIVENLLNYLGYAGRYDFTINKEEKELHPYQSANIIVNGETLGFIGKLHPAIMSDNVYVCEINLSKLNSIKTGLMKFKPLSKYPSIKKDVSFIFNKDVLCKDVIKDIKKASSKILSNVVVYDEYIKDNERSLTFTLTFLDENETLKEEDVMVVFNKIIDSIVSKYDAKLKNM